MSREIKLFISQIPFFRKDIFTYDEDNKHFILNILAHRRAGKSQGESWSICNDCQGFLAEDKIFTLRGKVDSRDPIIIYSAPTKLQARQVIWKYFKHDLKNLPGVKFNNSLLSVTVPRPMTQDEITIYLMASKNHDRARGLKVRKLYNDEAQDAPEKAVADSYSPALRDTNGALVQTGTAKGCDHFFKSLVHYQKIGANIFMFPISLTKIFSDKEILDIRESCVDGSFEREYMLDFFASLPGAFYHDKLTELEKDSLFFSAQKDDSTKVMGCDIGVGEGFSAWVAQQRFEDNNLDVVEYYTGYTTLDDLRQDLTEDDNKPDVIFLPHDAHTRHLHASTSYSINQAFKEVFPDSYIRTIKKTASKMADIDKVARHLHLLRFPGKDAATDTHIGLRNLKEFSRKKDPQTGVFMDSIDKSRGVDHAADALATLMLGLNVKDGAFLRKYEYKITDRDSGVRVGSSMDLLQNRRYDLAQGAYSPKGNLNGSSGASAPCPYIREAY